MIDKEQQTKTKVLILGGYGMLGHKFLLEMKDEYNAKATVKQDKHIFQDKLPDSHESDYFYNVDAFNYQSIEKVIDTFRPAYIINCIGLTKSLCSDEKIKSAIYLNSLLPHLLLETCLKYNTKLIQFSSDCIFSGEDGNYGELSIPDAKDIYGKTKFLGEVKSPISLTIRKSTIGLELNTKHGLLEWFINSNGKIEGFSNAIYSGLTSSELVRVIKFILNKKEFINGVINISSEPISKYELLKKLAKALKKDIQINNNRSFSCDRSLNGSNFIKLTNYSIPDWDTMLNDLAQEINKTNSSR